MIRAREPEIARILRGNALVEAERGWVASPTHLCAADLNPHHQAPRWGAEEQRGKSRKGGSSRWRYQVSGIDTILSSEDTSTPRNWDGYLATVAIYKGFALGCALRSRIVDFPRAYTHVPTTSARREFATIAFTCPEGAALLRGVARATFWKSDGARQLIESRRIREISRSTVPRRYVYMSMTVLLPNQSRRLIHRAALWANFAKPWDYARKAKGIGTAMRNLASRR